MALCWAAFEYFVKFDGTNGEINLALSNKLRFLITEAVMQEEEEHRFLKARSDEDKTFLLALYRAAAITASANKFCPFLASLQLQNLHMYLRTFAPKAEPRKVAKAIPKMPARMPGTTNELPPLAVAIPHAVLGPPTVAFDAISYRGAIQVLYGKCKPTKEQSSPPKLSSPASESQPKRRLMVQGSSRKVPGMPFINGRKDRDEDLLLFKELHRREKDRLASLLQPVSDEFEPNIAGKLKTPPATPLFPSLEMEANAPGNNVQREIPIIQPLSRFADNSDALKGRTVTVRTPNSKPNRIPQRSVTPGQKQRISASTENKNSKVAAQILNQKRAQFTTDSNRKTNVIANSAKPTNQKSSQTDFLSSNLSKDIKTKPENRGVSPSVRSTIAAQIPGFSNDTPPNLRTDRATSATRGRPVAANPTASVRQKQDPASRPRRQSCSPAEEREAKPKQQSATKSANSSANASPSHGFGRMMTTTKSQMDMAFKHMVIAKDRINSRHLGITSGRSSGQNELD
ncbi:hypothetical protein POTOM_038468 [Populus tomentosa]|uniref:Uncharacterized protein n=1 Tax=Populus tomentosa TaxID=118781 RepID=A0A8X7YZE1_POPTO|nr:hypothetical protein POTOM_038468 [Populus tomentosa]